MTSIYLDNLAATEPHPDVVAAMRPFYDGRHFGNPSSPHHAGTEPRRAVEEARARVAAWIGAAPGEILFTASGSESNNLALKGIAAGRPACRHLVAAPVEHMSVLHPLRSLEQAGYEVTWLPVDRHGRIDPDDLRRALRNDTALVSIGHAVAEIGTVQPIAALARVAAETGVPFHTDAVALAGRAAIDLGDLPVSAASISPQAFHGPRGVGLLFRRDGVSLRPQVEGGVQESGLRAGTEHVAGIVGTGVAAELASRLGPEHNDRLRRLGIDLLRRLRDEIEAAHPTGDPVDRIPGHASICLEGVEGEAILQGLDAHGIAAASGSACVSAAGKESHVLEAIGIDPALRRSSLVFSLGWFNRSEDIDALLEVLPGIVARLRAMAP